MLIGYKDFFPTILKSGFFSDEHETIASTVSRANEWIAQANVRVINVETVVLPNVNKIEDASKIGIYTSGEGSSRWYQLVRVWFETPSPA
ncbi:MAG: hypothetical protein JWM68_2332 [Verrucomicrobiales bacterium]|nr:hypothetical protein [Verrucomicrobiales bacterium]